MNSIFLGEHSEYIKNWFILTFPSWPAYTTLEFVDGTSQIKEINGSATWQNIGVKTGETNNNNSLTYCLLGKNVTAISSYAFYNCNSLTSIDIPSSVTSIEGTALSCCDSLTSVIFEGRTSAEITSMANYPWEIPNTSAIKPGIS